SGVDRGDVNLHIAHELEEADVERVWREIGSEVATVIHSGSVRRKGDRGEIRSRDRMRLEAGSFVIADEKQDPFLDCRRRDGGRLVEIMDVDLRGIHTLAHGRAGCAGILSSTNKLHAVDEGHGTLLSGILRRGTGLIISRYRQLCFPG